MNEDKNDSPVLNKQVSFYLPASLWGELQKAADAAMLSTSAFIRIAIVEKIVRMEQK